MVNIQGRNKAVQNVLWFFHMYIKKLDLFSQLPKAAQMEQNCKKRGVIRTSLQRLEVLPRCQEVPASNLNKLLSWPSAGTAEQLEFPARNPPLLLFP